MLAKQTCRYVESLILSVCPSFYSKQQGITFLSAASFCSWWWGSCLLQLSQLVSLEALHSADPKGLAHPHCSVASYLQQAGELLCGKHEIPQCWSEEVQMPSRGESENALGYSCPVLCRYVAITTFASVIKHCSCSCRKSVLKIKLFRDFGWATPRVCRSD